MSTANYLIIGGATKSGTTSLFKYLEDHPDVCAVELKETRFFLEETYPLPARYRLARNGIDKYEWYFGRYRGEKIKLDATPDYLFSKYAAENIRKYLADVRIIFILRDPVSRFISWYNYAISIGLLDKSTSLEEFYTFQKNNPVTEITPQHYRALEQGLYSNYLKTYFDIYGNERIFIALYDELTKQPDLLMRNISNFANIDYDFYKNYIYNVHNKTFKSKNIKIENLYSNLRYHIANYTNCIPLISKILRFINRKFINPIFCLLNRNYNQDYKNFDAKVIIELASYYRKDVFQLEKLLGRKTGWIRSYDREL